MHKRLVVAVLMTSAVTSGCFAGGDSGPGARDASGPPGAMALAVSEPTLVNVEHSAFEPSIVASPDGTLYVTAAPTYRPGPPGGPLSSFLWYSIDQGETWQEVTSPAGVHEAFPGLEGDVAVDSQGRLYFADINVAETFFHRWGPGPTWELSRPLATTVPVDDRPWLAAHGDGIVYYVVNTGESVPTPSGLAGGNRGGASIWLYTSEDAGMTWSAGRGVASASMCMPAASPADDATLLIACSSVWGLPEKRVDLVLSRDRGATLETAFSRELDQGTVFLTPGAAVDRAGNLYAAFLDDRVESTGLLDMAWTGDTPGRVLYVASTDDGATWTEHDVTPLVGRVSTVDASAGDAGTLAITFYATADLEPTADSAWFPYLMISNGAAADDPGWHTVRLLDEPAGVGATPPVDFFQNTIGPDNVVHVILQRDKPERDAVEDGPTETAADILHVRQKAGPNLR